MFIRCLSTKFLLMITVVITLKFVYCVSHIVIYVIPKLIEREDKLFKHFRFLFILIMFHYYERSHCIIIYVLKTNCKQMILLCTIREVNLLYYNVTLVTVLNHRLSYIFDKWHYLRIYNG